MSTYLPKKDLIPINDYFMSPNNEMEKIINFVKDRLDLNRKDRTYDGVIYDYIEPCLLKIANIGLPIFKEYVTPITIDIYTSTLSAYNLKGVKRINDIMLTRQSRIEGVIEKGVYLKRCQRLFDNIQITKDSVSVYYEYSFNELEKHSVPPTHYTILNNYLFFNKMFFDSGIKHYNTQFYIYYEGLPVIPEDFFKDYKYLIELAILKEMYRDVFKSSEQYALIDASFNETCEILAKNNLNETYPKKIRMDKSYW